MRRLQSALKEHFRAREQNITVYRVWDRQTPRHQWRLVVETDNEAHAKNVLQAHKKRLASAGDSWKNGQIGWEVGQISGGAQHMDKSRTQTRDRPSIKVVSESLRRRKARASEQRPRGVDDYIDETWDRMVQQAWSDLAYGGGKIGDAQDTVREMQRGRLHSQQMDSMVKELDRAVQELNRAMEDAKKVVMRMDNYRRKTAPR